MNEIQLRSEGHNLLFQPQTSVWTPVFHSLGIVNVPLLRINGEIAFLCGKHTCSTDLRKICASGLSAGLLLIKMLNRPRANRVKTVEHREVMLDNRARYSSLSALVAITIVELHPTICSASCRKHPSQTYIGVVENRSFQFDVRVYWEINREPHIVRISLV